jgi:hypothetical protein
MNRNFRCVALLLSTCLAPAANAVPIYFDFSGTVTGVDNIEGVGAGASITGGFTFETDRLESRFDQGSGLYSFLDRNPATPAEPLAFLNFGAGSLLYPPDQMSAFAVINFVDACTPAGCSPTAPENFSMYATTGPVTTPAYTGSIQQSAFYVASTALTRLPDAPFLEFFDYFDGHDLEPGSITSLPLHDLAGFYSQGTLDCVGGDCVSSMPGSMSFSINSVTRGVGARAVPEPGTLSLMACAFAGLLLFRRRAPAR